MFRNARSCRFNILAFSHLPVNILVRRAPLLCPSGWVKLTIAGGRNKEVRLAGGQPNENGFLCGMAAFQEANHDE